MTTDRELIELAAKAAEIEICVDDNGTPWFGGDKFIWNPLTDNRHALSLAIKLSLGISIVIGAKRTDVVCFTHTNCSAIELHSGNPGAATRRAIVRAAAEIGKTIS